MTATIRAALPQTVRVLAAQPKGRAQDRKRRRNR
jgi:hypothetical protein